MPHTRWSSLMAFVCAMSAVAAVTSCSSEGGGGGGDAGGPTVAPTSEGTAAPVVAKAGEPWLAYESKSARIRLVRPDGSDDHALDDVTSGAEDNPDWSPDGQQLAFVGMGSDGTGNPGLWVIGADGSGLRRVVGCASPCQYLDDPAWSPDGRSIAYSRMAPDATHGGTLESVDVASGATRTVATGKLGEFFSGVRFAPDGTQLVAEHVRATAGDYENVIGVTLTRIDAATGALTPLTKPELFAETADWSPSGDVISFSALRVPGAERKDLYVIGADGTGMRRVTTLTEGDAVHSEFVDDSSVIFVHTSDQSIRRVDLATGKVSAFAAQPVIGFHPRLRPVG